MKVAFWLWVGVMIGVAVAGSWLCRTVAAAMIASATPSTYPDFLMGMTLPIPVVQVAPNWSVIFAVWLVFVALGFCGYNACQAATRAGTHGVALAVVGYAAVGFALTFFGVAQSIDTYYYTAFARLYGVYGINPYALPAPVRLNDSTLTENLVPLGNPPFPDPYGPGFTLLAGIVGRLEANLSLWTQLWTWRIFAVIAILAVAAALAYMLKRNAAEERSRRVATFVFHPLTLYESGAGGHNDVLMVAAAIWSYAIVDEFPLVAGLLVGAAIAIKYFAALIVPFLVLRAARKNVLAAALVAVLAVLVPLLCFRPFMFGAAGANTLVKVASSLSMSPNWLLALPLFASRAPNLLLRSVQLTIVAGFAILLVISVLRYARSLHNGELYRAITGLLWSLPALHPWYLMWLVPVSAARGRWATYAWWFAALSILIYAHEAVLPTPLNHTIFIVLTVVLLVVPILIAFRVTRSRTSSDP